MRNRAREWMRCIFLEERREGKINGRYTEVLWERKAMDRGIGEGREENRRDLRGVMRFLYRREERSLHLWERDKMITNVANSCSIGI